MSSLSSSLSSSLCLRPFALVTSSFVLAFILSACGSTGTSLPPPSYAITLDSRSFEITCNDGSRRDIIVRNTSTEIFYKADGTQKTREEFCNESTSRPRARLQ